MAPAFARDYAAVSAFDDHVEYLDPATVKTDGDIKTFWTKTIYVRTNSLGFDWTSERESIDCKNNRMISLNITGYLMNGDVVASTENYANVQRRWIDIPPETAAAAMEDAVCHGKILETDSGASFMEVVPLARRVLLQMAAKTPQATPALQQAPPPPAYSVLSRVKSALRGALQQTSTLPPAYSASEAETGQAVYSASECIGPIVASVCQGTILPNQATHPICHGEMLNGTCTGPMF